MAYKLKAKVLISKKPTCNCGGFYHPGEEFEESNEQKVKRYIAQGWVEVLNAPLYATVDGEQKKIASLSTEEYVEKKEAKSPVKTKELKTSVKTK